MGFQFWPPWGPFKTSTTRAPARWRTTTTTTTTTTTPKPTSWAASSNSNANHTLHTVTIALAVVAAVLLVAVMIVAGVCLHRRCQRQKRQQEQRAEEQQRGARERKRVLHGVPMYPSITSPYGDELAVLSDPETLPEALVAPSDARTSAVVANPLQVAGGRSRDPFDQAEEGNAEVCVGVLVPTGGEGVQRRADGTWVTQGGYGAAHYYSQPPSLRK